MGVTQPLLARASTAANSLASGSFHCSPIEGGFGVIPTKEVLFSQEGQDTGMPYEAKLLFRFSPQKTGELTKRRNVTSGFDFTSLIAHTSTLLLWKTPQEKVKRSHSYKEQFAIHVTIQPFSPGPAGALTTHTRHMTHVTARFVTASKC